MATNTPTIVINQDHTQYALWADMGNADTGSAVAFSQFPDRTVGVVGTFAGATVTIQGSMDGSTWVTLRDSAGVALTFTAAGISLISENAIQVRPVTSGGAGTDVSVYLNGSR